MVCHVFICYRRDDTGSCAAPLHDRLATHFGQRNVFLDQAVMRAGDHFPAEIETAIRSSHVVLTLIGKDWLAPTRSGARRRVDDRHDWVRREILLAWKYGVRVMPVLVDGAAMPDRRQLPRPLWRLATSHAIQLRTDGWQRDVTHLIDQIEQHVREQRRGRFAGVATIRKEAPLSALIANACHKPVNIAPPLAIAGAAWHWSIGWMFGYAGALYAAGVAISTLDLKQAKALGRKRAHAAKEHGHPTPHERVE